MDNLRFRKIWGDIWINEGRSFMAILAIAIGIFGAGSVLITYAILEREIDANYMGTTPASAKLFMPSVDRELAERVEALPAVEIADLRRTIRARVQIGSEAWLPLKLMVIDDFNNLQISTFELEQGVWPPAAGEILLERSSKSIKEIELGNALLLRTPASTLDGYPVTVRGIVHDPAQAPGWQDGIEYGYISAETLLLLGETDSFNELHILTADDPLNQAYNDVVAQEVLAFVENEGNPVSAVIVPTPGVHPHTDQMQSLLFLLQAFGALTLVLSAILVATIIAALLQQQMRQIGAMKAIGGRTRQISSIYFGLVLIFGTVALVIGLPLSISAGRGFSAFIAQLLNFDIIDNRIPIWVFVTEAIIGLTVPLLAAAVPIIRGSRLSVREAIGDTGMQGQFGSGKLDETVANVQGLSRPLMLSLRNTFRRRTRMVLVVSILAVGGATFMSSININRSWLNTIAVSFAARKYDFKLDFSEPVSIDQLEAVIQAVPGVVEVESWNSAVVVEELTNGADGLRFNLSAVPAQTDLINYPLIEGRWLEPGDTNAIVINHELLYDDHASIQSGDTVTLRINGEPTEWQVVGVVQEVGAPRRGLGIPASAYVNLDYFNQVMGAAGTTTSARIVTDDHSVEAQAAMTVKLEQAFADANLRPADFQASTTRRQILEDHLVVIISFLGMMAVLIAAVGGLALTSVISINVMERAREIGVMRAIGGSTGTVLQVVMVEGIVMGLLSWVAAVIIARPLSSTLGNLAGWLFIRSDLENVFSGQTTLIWLALIMLISIGASFYPAWTATRLTVREIISYE
ncbi:MAG: ABC transporter permease [Anaerolineae bacterium]